MNEFGEPTESRQTPECRSLDEGLVRLTEMALAKKQAREKDDAVLIAVCGIPGSGKTELCQRFIKQFGESYLIKDGNVTAHASCIIGAEGLTDPIRQEKLKCDYLIIEDVAPRIVMDKKLKRFIGHSCDLFVCINNPKRTKESIMDFQEGADLIIHNPESLGQKTPQGHIF